MTLAPPWFRTGAVGIAMSVMLFGCSRVTGLPAVPASLTSADAGLDGLGRATEEARALSRPPDASERSRWETTPPTDAVDRARVAADLMARGDSTGGVASFGAVVAAAPADLVIGNAFRMAIYRQKRLFLEAARERGERSPAFPERLGAEPLATLERAAATREAKELRIQIALCYVDRMFLDPALEVRAPASIDSVHEFTSVLADHPYDVPALVGRGLNYLNRPRRLVWPEHPAPPADAASHDLALAAAVGSKVGGASPRVKGLLLLLLGDAYAHEGRAGLARSWWTLAGEATDDRRVHAELAVRAGWPEPEMPDRIEARLEERMAEVEAPVSDLSFLWDDGARGPW